MKHMIPSKVTHRRLVNFYVQIFIGKCTNFKKIKNYELFILI